MSSDRFIRFCSEFEQLLNPYLHNQNLEIQERASNLWQIILIMKDMWSLSAPPKNLLDEEEPKADDEETATDANSKAKEEAQRFVSLFYAYALNPVAAKAQNKVPVPAGLDLDVPFEEVDSEDEAEADDDDDDEENESHHHTVVKRRENNIRLVASDEDEDGDEAQEEEDEEEEVVPTRKPPSAAQSRRYEVENNPNYLKSKAGPATTASAATAAGPSKKTKKTKATKKKNANIEEASEAFNELNFAGDETEVVSTKKSVVIPGLVSSEKYLLSMKANKKAKGKGTKKSKKKGGKKHEEEDDDDDEDENVPKVVIRALEMPDGFDPNAVDEEEDTGMDDLDPHKALAKVSFDDILAAEKEAKRAAAAAAAAPPKKVSKKTKTKSSTLLKESAEGNTTTTTTRKKKTKKATTTKAVADLIGGDGDEAIPHEPINTEPEIKKKKKKVIKKKTKSQE